MADSGPLNGESLNGNGFPRSWRQELFLSLSKQGPAWVLLTCCAIGIGYLIDKHVPALVGQIQGGFEKNREGLSRDIDKLVAASDRSVQSNASILTAMQQSLVSIEKLHASDQKLMQAALDELKRRNTGGAGGQ